MRYTRTLLAALFFVPAVVFGQSSVNSGSGMLLPDWGIKTNLLYDATATLNLGAEFRIGDRTSAGISAGYNPWIMSKKKNMKWQHVLVRPEFRWWLKETFSGHFFGAYADYVYYNIGNLPHGPFSRYMRDHRFNGDLWGVGGSYGYRVNFNHRWAMEATVGIGYAYLSYDKYACGNCGEKLGHETRHYFGPTRLGLNLIFGIGGKKAERQPSVPVYTAPPTMPVKSYEPRLTTNFIVPEAEAVKARSESYTAYLDFEVGRWEVLPDFRNNAAELRHIHELIRRVAGDEDATITGISVTGYASPEGTYASNMTLSQNRTQALKNHVNATYGLREGLFTVRGAGEDWATLETLISEAGMAEKGRILEIIRSTGDPDECENRLKALQGGRIYRQIFDEYYPRLRRSDYKIDYTVVPFSVEKGKEVLRTRPGNLSLNEMFLIANTYEPGSRAFNEVFEIAAQVFPDSDTANLNAASVALTHNDATSAARYLGRVKEQSATYWNNMGVLFWLQGNTGQAAECFTRAGAQAAANSAELERYFRSVNR